jgi:hypothetical protein
MEQQIYNAIDVGCFGGPMNHVRLLVDHKISYYGNKGERSCPRAEIKNGERSGDGEDDHETLVVMTMAKRWRPIKWRWFGIDDSNGQ